MSNAAKHRKKAAEFEQLKQIDRAIAAYIKAIEESESAGEDVDVVLLNKVGDLTLRQGRVADAVTYYERAVEHYAVSGLFNNAIALCNKILRSAPGRSNVYFTLGRICAKKGLRGDATRNFLEYATRMQQEGRVDEGMRALAEVADLMPELTEIRRLVEEHAVRVGIDLPRRKTPPVVQAAENERAVVRGDDKSRDLIFLDVGLSVHTARNTPPLAPRIRTPRRGEPPATWNDAERRVTPDRRTGQSESRSSSLDDFLLFDPSRPGAVTPHGEMSVVDHSVLESTIDPIVAPAADAIAADAIAADAIVADAIVADAIVADAIALVGLDSQPVPDLEQIELSPAVSNADAAVNVITDERQDNVTVDPVEPLVVASLVDDVAAPPIDAIELAAIEGLESNGTFDVETFTLIDGLTSDEASTGDSPSAGEQDAGLTWIMPQDAIETADRSVDLLTTATLSDVSDLDVDALPDLMIEDFDHVADDPHVVAVTGGRIGTPAYTMSVPRSLTPIETTPVPEVDAAIEAGAMAAALGEAIDASDDREPAYADVESMDHALVEEGAVEAVVVEEVVMQEVVAEEVVVEEVAEEYALADTLSRPPFRLDPHDFILPGELPPLVVDDEFVEAGLRVSRAAFDTSDVIIETTAIDPEVNADTEESRDDDHDSTLVTPRYVDEIEEADPATDPTLDDDDDGIEGELRASIEAHRAVRTTPSLPLAAVAAEANVVATSRCDELRAAVVETPHDWMLRRRLAEALFEVGEREGGLAELQTALSGFAHLGDLQSAAAVADDLVRISPERIQYHQKRVELSVRLADQQRLRVAYLDLADTLVRTGDDTRAHAVYARVLEIDPWDERARNALGPAAPPPPPRATPDDEFVSLADWLREDEPGTTRMRMREPAVSGDEQKDFDSLLRHFKEGVSRSLGEEDYESHYDLGVAYKEMGLLDDAIEEFQKALRSRRHRLPAYEALGQCFVEQSRHAVAVTVLTRALHEPGLGDEQRVGVLYLLAYSCEALQRWDEARSYYSRVYATDIHFRDVAARLAALDLVAR